MMGNWRLVPASSSMSLIHSVWDLMVFADRPMSLVPRLVNSGSSLANAPNSVVQTGVKSLRLWSLAKVARQDMRIKHKHTLGVRKENNPVVTNEVVELDVTLLPSL